MDRVDGKMKTCAFLELRCVEASAHDIARAGLPASFNQGGDL